MALLLCLLGMAALAHGCLHCHSNFSEKFSFYRHHVNLKSWWVGDIPVSGALLTDWSDRTMKELHLTIPAAISECRSPAQSRPPQRKPRAAAHVAPPPTRSPGEAGQSGESRVPEDGSAVPGEDVLPG
ncbi:Izumo sperm-egg fusion protein 4 [Plecturocebus cupreus]